MEQSQALTVFDFEGQEVRHIIENGELLMVLADVCNALGIADHTTAARRLDDDEKLLRTICVAGQNRAVLFTNEPGFYHLTRSSRKPEAQRLRRKVDHEILPSIRKTGSYSIQQQEQPHQLTLPTLAERLSDPVAVNQLLAELQHAQYHQKQAAYHQGQADRYTKRAAQCIVNPQSVLSDDDLEDAPVVDVSTPEGYAARLESEILRQIAGPFL